MFLFAGCLSEPLPTKEPESLAAYVINEVCNESKVECTKEMRLVLDYAEATYREIVGDITSPQYRVKIPLNADFDLMSAKQGQAIFLQEGRAPQGIYDDLTLHVAQASVVVDGQSHPLQMDDLHFDTSWTLASSETRLAIGISGDLALVDGVWTFEQTVGRFLATVVPDLESGSDVHHVGQVVDLLELQNDA